MAHAGGRPTKYRPEINTIDFEEYLSTTGREQTKLITVEGFALFLGVNDDTLYEWAKVHPEFSVTLRKLKIMQREQLIDDGIYGGKEVNATIVKLLLQNNHGMKEKADVTTDNKPIQPLIDITLPESLGNVLNNNSDKEDQPA